ncbi:MAG: succinate dehydrogenase cytochrome b subunit [Myxococcota bacterium]
MSKVVSLPQTTVGKKVILAVSGAVLFGFLIGHLLGNLQVYPIFGGAQALNEYAASLRNIPGGLWPPRLVLLGAIIAHIWAAVALAWRNSDARPERYQYKRKDQVTNYAARTMMFSGPIVGLYIVYHLLHLTIGMGVVGGYDHQNVYNNVVYSFADWQISLVYIVANLMLGTHLFHGAWSWFQSLGLNHPRYNAYRKGFAIGLAAFLTIGNVSIPIAVLTGIVEPTDEQFCFEELAKVEGECDGFSN